MKHIFLSLAVLALASTAYGTDATQTEPSQEAALHKSVEQTEEASLDKQLPLGIVNMIPVTE